MRVKSILSVVFSCTIALSEAASSWGLSDATISVQGKGAGAGGGFKDKLSDRAPLSKPVSLGHSETLKILLTATEDKKGKRPHQLFLLVTDTTSGLETSFPFSAKDSGKGKLELMQKDFPAQFLAANSSLQATVIIASFGASKPINKHIFNLNLIVEPGSPASHFEAPLRYGKRDEIHHTFRGDPKSPPMIISIFFTLVVLATVPVLYGTWAYLGANVNHLQRALQAAPISHGLFYTSILALEGVFILYYTSWNLFQTLPAVAAVGLVTFLSGSRALSEVQARRLAGLS